ncbi:hypothetical protein BASA83_002100 [Batrachochytrium salamandrivorans]|nr:hypothetical protein BASA81_015683 [Batrachochytrium salamandrivorans]KAH9275328.1 hypothetical protein BASA83_002100 [Batrachochytrium salamandrivorans]
MLSLYGLFILLLTAEAIHAQGGKNNDDGANQNSGSKDATSLPRRTDSLRRTRASWKTKASSSVDPQLGNGSKGPRWLRNLFGSSTSHDPPQPDKIPLPARVGKAEAESYNQDQDIEQYNAFIENEAKYFKSAYFIKKKLGKGDFGTVYLATKRSNGFKVACKSIPKETVAEYTLESSPPPRCHTPNPLSRHKKLAAAQCRSPRPSKLFVPYEVAVQMHLSRPGHENIYVPRVLDYITLENEFMLIMDYLDESWVSLASYMKEKIRLDIEDARNIIKEIINAAISLKQHGVFHNDIHSMYQ